MCIFIQIFVSIGCPRSQGHLIQTGIPERNQREAEPLFPSKTSLLYTQLNIKRYIRSRQLCSQDVSSPFYFIWYDIFWPSIEYDFTGLVISESWWGVDKENPWRVLPVIHDGSPNLPEDTGEMEMWAFTFNRDGDTLHSSAFPITLWHDVISVPL